MFNKDETLRLKDWQTFRKSLSQYNFTTALARTLDFWTHAPFTPYYLDIGDTTNWPDPWDLIENNHYCDVAKALGIVYTITLSEHRCAAEIRLYYDKMSHRTYSLAVFDGKYFVNFDNERILAESELPLSLELQRTYSAEELKLEEY